MESLYAIFKKKWYKGAYLHSLEITFQPQTSIVRNRGVKVAYVQSLATASNSASMGRTSRNQPGGWNTADWRALSVPLRRLGFFILGIMSYHRYGQGNDMIQLLEVLQIYLKFYERYVKSRKSHIFQCQVLLTDP